MTKTAHSSLEGAYLITHLLRRAGYRVPQEILLREGFHGDAELQLIEDRWKHSGSHRSVEPLTGPMPTEETK